MSEQCSHSRRNALTGDWVLVSPQRTQRPWQGQVEHSDVEELPEFDANCYLCPGNARANDERNPDYNGVFVFDNDFPALSQDAGDSVEDGGLFAHRSEVGVCRVICYSERHDERLATMPTEKLVAALQSIVGEFKDLDSDPRINYVQVFENRGRMMGCSNEHPHGQIWATSSIPNEPAKEQRAQQLYLDIHGRSLLRDYLQSECETGERLVYMSDHFVALVPFWAVWPYEILLLPRDRVAAPDELNANQLQDLAIVLQTVLRAYERLFSASVPYSLGLHPRPSDGRKHDGWQFHAHIYPPLLRSASVRKHMVGFEMLAMPQRDLTPELAAQQLRDALQ